MKVIRIDLLHTALDIPVQSPHNICHDQCSRNLNHKSTVTELFLQNPLHEASINIKNVLSDLQVVALSYNKD